MARFYASIQGNRGEATRMGTPASGITGHVRGWDLGVRIDGRAAPENMGKDGSDLFHVEITGGSSGVGRTVYLARVWESDTGRMLELDPAFGGRIYNLDNPFPIDR